MRTTLFQHTALQNRQQTSFSAVMTVTSKKNLGWQLFWLWGILSHRCHDYKFAPRPPQTSNTYILMKITERSHYRRDTIVISTKNPGIIWFHLYPFWYIYTSKLKQKMTFVFPVHVFILHVFSWHVPPVRWSAIMISGLISLYLILPPCWH